MKKFFKILLTIVLYILIVLIILYKAKVIDIKILSRVNEKSPDECINNGLSLSDESLSKSNGKEDRYYYNQLDSIAKTIYDKLIDEEEKVKTGTAKIEFTDNEFDSLLSQDDGMEILRDEYQNAVDAIKYDNVDLFYVDFTKMALKTITYTRGNSVRYEVYFDCSEDEKNYLEDTISSDIDEMIDEIEQASDEILAGASGSNYQKIQYVHNWLIDNLEYDTTYSRDNTRNIYGALVERNVVCEGYAKAFKYLMDKLEIPCILVAGEAVNSEGTKENHMWNYVEINNVWYAIDVTWDDPILVNGGNLSNEDRYKYFCQGDNINSNHYLGLSISEDGKNFEYPELYHKE